MPRPGSARLHALLGQLKRFAGLLACTGFQCSYCTPGILLTAKALLDANPRASDEEIREYLAGNLCRCGSYVKILDAVRSLTLR